MAAKTKWTDDQLKAIETREKTLLVSAAAGSGKTAVLTERAVRRMLDSQNPIEADRLLVVTFTRAAAQEMKQRMLQKLAERIKEAPDDLLARRQRQLLERATIGTIDSLCLNLLKENWQQIGLPAAFRVGDTQELEAMQQEAVNETLEAAYKSGDEVFEQLLQLLSQRRGDQSLAATVLRVLDFARSHPFYTDWLDNKLKAYSAFASPQQSVWGKILLDYALETAKRCLAKTQEAVELLHNEPELENYLPAFMGDLTLFTELKKALLQSDWDAAKALLNGYCAVGLKAVKKGADPETKELLKRTRDKNKKAILRLSEKVICCNSAEFFEDVSDLLPKLKCLFSLVKETDERLLAQKREDGVFDFSDLEQFAVNLLAKKDGDSYRPTELARELQGNFDEIMVDEYQDVNAVQDMIVNALSNGKNLFMVGDVKQSIYRFRQACPEIFINRSECYKNSDNEFDAALITLSGNFRSRIEIAQAVNSVFSPLFSKAVGELVYDEGHRLEALAAYPDYEQAGAEFHLLEQGDLNAQEAALAEAKYVAKQIKALLSSGAQVAENGAMRAISPSDIAILLRSPKKRALLYSKALEKEKVEAMAALESGFLSSAEITAVLNLLRAVENPTRDIELVGAMLSPIFSFSDDEVAKIRINSPKGHFCVAVEGYAEKDEHTAEFLRFFNHLRRLFATVDTAQLITAAVEETGFDLKCRAMKNGKQRFSNLLLLIQYAEGYHNNGHRGLSAFLRMIERLEEQNGDLPPAFVGEQKNAVTITSIHKSKGLEWPVVFLCEAGRDHSFLKNDMIAPTILHSQLGFACVRRDEKLKKQFATAPLDAVRIETARSMLSEEMRILYVAATRARERLIITAAMKKAMETAEVLQPDAALLDPIAVRECKNYAQWLIMSLGCNGNVAEALDNGGTLGGVAMHFDFLKNEEAEQNENEQTELSVQIPERYDADFEEIKRIKERLQFVYPYAAAARLPAKLSVSQITHQSREEYRFSQKPSFVMGENALGSERGTAIHSFMQYCDYEKAAQNSTTELLRMAEQGILTERQAKIVNTAVVDEFFRSALAKRIFAADEVMREFAFMVSAAKCAAAEKYSVNGGEATMLQGIADCILIEKDHAVIIDYKTDRVKTPQELVLRYGEQLSLYREMLGSVLKVPVKQCLIWSFALGCEIEIS